MTWDKSVLVDSGNSAAARLTLYVSFDQFKDIAEFLAALIGDGFLWKFGIAAALLGYRLFKKHLACYVSLRAAQSFVSRKFKKISRFATFEDYEWNT